MKLTEPQQAFACLWEFISGSKASPKAALNNLESHFTKPTPGRETWCVSLNTGTKVVCDLADQLSPDTAWS